VPRRDTLSLFKRRGDLIVVIGVGWRFKSRVSVRPSEADLGALSLVMLTEIFGQSVTTSPPSRKAASEWVCPRRGRLAKHHVAHILTPTPELVIAIAEWLRVSLHGV
jgi:hypothetical protein